MKKGTVIAFSIGICLAVSTAGFHSIRSMSKVSDTQKKIEDVADDKKKLEDEKRKLEKDIKDVESKKKDVVEYIENLDTKLGDLSDKISSNEKEIKKIKKVIASLKEDEKKAENDRKNQYDTMKKRIKYMYENGKNDYIKLIFQSKSITDMLNRVEYINKITMYDKNMFSKYQETCDNIAEKKKVVESELYHLNEYKESLRYKKSTVNSLVKKKSAQLDKYKGILGNSNAEIEKYMKKIADKENELEKLLEQKRNEIAVKEAENQNDKDGKKPSVNVSGYCWPLPVAGTITSHFGYRNAPTAGASTYHKGIDISVPVGTKVLASQSGTVVTAAYSASAGNYVCIYHGNGIYTYYMHCSSLAVSEGKSVSRGQKIALSGSTGVSTGPHLHFAINVNGEYVNPLNYISQ